MAWNLLVQKSFIVLVLAFLKFFFRVSCFSHVTRRQILLDSNSLIVGKLCWLSNPKVISPMGDSFLLLTARKSNTPCSEEIKLPPTLSGHRNESLSLCLASPGEFFIPFSFVFCDEGRRKKESLTDLSSFMRKKRKEAKWKKGEFGVQWVRKRKRVHEQGKHFLLPPGICMNFSGFLLQIYQGKKEGRGYRQKACRSERGKKENCNRAKMWFLLNNVVNIHQGFESSKENCARFFSHLSISNSHFSVAHHFHEIM